MQSSVKIPNEQIQLLYTQTTQCHIIKAGKNIRFKKEKEEGTREKP
jgi:hypothetical protein